MEQTANFYDVVVIGGGPAGLTAALYLARARYRVVVVEKDHFGGQITITSEVVNYPGVGRTSGTELTETMRKQAEGFGAEFLLAEVTGLELSGDIKTVRTGRGDLKCFGVLLATGAHPRRIGFPGELVPLTVVKMFSSSAATGLLLDIFKEYGTDSYIGRIASISMSCTETIFYTMSVYYMTARVTKMRYTLTGALLATLAGVTASVVLAGMMT
mgnify:CR=1 FL=1